jgi:hypothetical protein
MHALTVTQNLLSKIYRPVLKFISKFTQFFIFKSTQSILLKSEDLLQKKIYYWKIEYIICSKFEFLFNILSHCDAEVHYFTSHGHDF